MTEPGAGPDSDRDSGRGVRRDAGGEVGGEVGDEVGLEVGGAVRRLLRRSEALRDSVVRLFDAEAATEQAVNAAYEVARRREVRRRLAGIPLARLAEVSAERLPLGPLGSRYASVAEVLDADLAELDAVPGVGEQTARRARAAALQVAAAVEQSTTVGLGFEPADPVTTGLLTAVHRLEWLQSVIGPHRSVGQRVAAELPALERAAAPMRGRVRHFFAGAARRAEAGAAVGRLRQWLDWTDTSGLSAQLDDGVRRVEAADPDPQKVWRDYEQRAARYTAVLAGQVDRSGGPGGAGSLTDEAAQGFLPADIVARLAEQQLDGTHLRAALRGYQSFGARFALVQRRCMLGDEMGLGKTVEAVAVAAHLKAVGGKHFLVVCPAGVLINWVREVGVHSTLAVHQVYGEDRDVVFERWLTDGDVAVTTYESLRTLPLPADLPLSLLVVDEAHYVKNPQALRSQQVAALTRRAERVLFLTGTPMENRVEEFRNLVAILNPALADQVEQADAVAGATAFRRAVAQVYLRRNQVDVLTELPELVQVPEWEQFTPADERVYRQAVRRGHFMQMRRAAYEVADPVECAKLDRLLELVDDARENQLKVLVFSYFRTVLDVVHGCLSVDPAAAPTVFGPLTGDTVPADRQQLVDDFSAVEGHAVLVSQIQAGGVGLNLQAASVVVLCEPQLKPTLEAQAVARAHRMGQVRSVRVHRLLVVDSVDERLLQILGLKAALFDSYARRSDVADATPEATDVEPARLSEVEVARRIVAEERRRLEPGTLHEPDTLLEPDTLHEPAALRPGNDGPESDG